MITINNNALLLKRFKDDFYFTNKLTTNASYELILLGCNGVETSIETVLLVGTIDVNYTTLGTKILNTIKDGKYKIIFEGYTIYFSSWKNHRNPLIDLIEKALCCNCKGCGNSVDGDCTSREAKACIRNQSLFNYIQTYYNLIKPFSLTTPIQINTFLIEFTQEVIDNNNCFITSQLCKQILETSIDGKTHVNEDLFNYYISVYYLALYFYDVTYIATTVLTESEIAEEKEYLINVYKYNIIKKCIRNLGINIEDLLTVITTTENLTVYYWQLANPSLLITDEIPLITQLYLNSKPNKSFDEFRTGQMINYILIGRPVFAIQATTLQSFIIEDYLGNDITNEFDVDYNATLQVALFVAKEYVSVINTFFKFKTIYNV